MDTYVVNLDRSADRLADFTRVNDHIGNVHRFSAVDGTTADRQAPLRAGIFEASILQAWAPGAIGCALSHLALWDEVIRAQRPALICEDDAVFHYRFVAAAEQLFGAIASDWDIVLWGWSYRSPFAFDLPGINTTHWINWADLTKARLDADAFQSHPVAPTIVRMRQAFGTFGYSISPAGAQKLRSFCLPIRKMRVPGVASTFMPNNAIDAMMNVAYPQLLAYASLPQLVMARDDVPSTITYGAQPTQR